MNKWLVSARDESHIWTEIAVWDTLDGALEHILTALGTKVDQWFVNRHKIIGNGGIQIGEAVFINHKDSEHQIMITTIGYNTLSDDPCGIAQEFIKEWQRL